MLLYAACLMGFTGSLHCLGMCGPIAFALPVRSNKLPVKMMRYGLYNIGRIVTYMMLGLIVGIVGKGFVMADMQQTLSIVTGALMIVSALLIPLSLNISFMNRFTETIRTNLKGAFHFYFQQKGNSSLFMLGILNGLLPCGMLYMAMLGALSSGNAFSGAAFMAGFGLGTVPAMFAVCMAGNVAIGKWKSIVYKVSPVLACLLGAWLILRGLQVDVPLFGPVHECCRISPSH